MRIFGINDILIIVGMRCCIMEYIGYAASLIILISLLMSSVRKLRWINLLGSITFAVYGFLIDSLPVALLNIGTVIINIYYLYHMYLAKDYFKLLPITGKTKYFEYFLSYYEKDIKSYIEEIDVDIDKAEMSFAGVFVCSKHDENTLMVDLDYVVPAYRDFKIGKYIYTKQKDLFLSKGYNRLLTYTSCSKHKKYLEKMGFEENEELSSQENICYVININKDQI